MTPKVTVTLKQNDVIRRTEGRIDVTVDCVRLGDRIAAVPTVLPWLLPTIDLFSDTATGYEFLIRSTCHTPLLRDAKVGRRKEVLSFSPP